MANIKSLPTVYGGIRYRSRLEARWAVFLDYMDIDFIYEPEGYTDGKVCYLPDFWLPAHELFIEIKPGPLSDAEEAKAKMVVEGTGHRLLALIGFPMEPIQFMADMKRTNLYGRFERDGKTRYRMSYCSYFVQCGCSRVDIRDYSVEPDWLTCDCDDFRPNFLNLNMAAQKARSFQFVGGVANG